MIPRQGSGAYAKEINRPIRISSRKVVECGLENEPTLPCAVSQWQCSMLTSRICHPLLKVADHRTDHRSRGSGLGIAEITRHDDAERVLVDTHAVDDIEVSIKELRVEDIERF